MAKPDQAALNKSLAEFIAFLQELNLPNAITPLAEFQVEFQSKAPTLKVLHDPFHKAYSLAYSAARDVVYDHANYKAKSGMTKQYAEFERTSKALWDAMFPTDYPETEISGLAGNAESTTVIGDTKDAKKIAQHCLDIAQKFSAAVFKQDLASAYDFCASEFKSTTSQQEFVSSLKRANSRYGGPAVDWSVECITWIYADAKSRKKSNTSGDWPKLTPKPNKRAIVIGFWHVNKEQKRGRSICFWVTEEGDGYRIAKFKQYLQ